MLHDIPPAERPAVVAALARTLRPGGCLFIREPMRFITGQELAGLMEAAGLQAVSSRMTEVFTQGAVYEGVFRAPGGTAA